MFRVLLVEDDPTIAKIIQYYLAECKDYEVVWTRDAGEALYAARNPFDVVLLDIMLPDVDGIELCAKLRESMYCPIIFISCIDDEDMIVQALETGGDDYLTKPFNNRVLHARIEANLRRVRMERTDQPKRVCDFPDFTLDENAHLIRRGGKSFPLAPIEFGLLTYFIDHPGHIITLDELYGSVWGANSFGDVRTVIVHVYNLRKKIEEQPGSPKYIINVRGKGYYFDPSGGAKAE